MLDWLAELVVKPVDGAGGMGIVIGPQASTAELTVLRERVAARSARLDRAAGRWQLSTVADARSASLAPRHVDLRPFAVNDGDDVWVLPGGLTRVALPEGALVVNSSQGGGSKDTWVLAGERTVRPRPSTGRPAPSRWPARSCATGPTEAANARSASSSNSNTGSRRC